MNAAQNFHNELPSGFSTSSLLRMILGIERGCPDPKRYEDTMSSKLSFQHLVASMPPSVVAYILLDLGRVWTSVALADECSRGFQQVLEVGTERVDGYELYTRLSMLFSARVDCSISTIWNSVLSY
jgi:hypothetical protein